MQQSHCFSSYYYYSRVNVFFFFLESFNLWRPLLMIVLYHQTKTPISFWCRRGLNLRSFIQPSEILPVELTGTYKSKWSINHQWNNSSTSKRKTMDKCRRLGPAACHQKKHKLDPN